MRPLILVLVATEILICRTSFSLSFMSCFRIFIGGGGGGGRGWGEQIDTGVGFR